MHSNRENPEAAVAVTVAKMEWSHVSNDWTCLFALAAISLPTTTTTPALITPHASYTLDI